MFGARHVRRRALQVLLDHDPVPLAFGLYWKRANTQGALAASKSGKRALEELSGPLVLPVVDEVKPHLADLFKGIYLKRTITVWLMWICAYIVTYGLTAWAPSLFTRCATASSAAEFVSSTV